MTRLIIDTDTAGDDVFSLLIGLRDPRIRLEAITVCCGNVAFEQEIENALYTVEQAGRAGEVPVYAGCSRPLISEWEGAEYVHGRDGMGDSFFPLAAQRAEPQHAVDELVRRIHEQPGELTILAQAPLTNLAAAVVRDPTIAGKVAHLYVMGGGEGNITPAAEYNFYVDPEAAKIVFAAGFPITLFTWTLTRTHGVFDDAKLARITELDTPLARFFGQVNRKAREFDDQANHLGGSTHPDSMTCAAIADPSLILATEDAVVDVETRGELTRGWSLIDTLGRVDRPPNARVVVDYDTDRFFELMLETLA
ncbi:MAG TPA: nucleoside hydrolase [Gaiellaceae bacterium]|nr:nucleoside hydrolase [Gaiellaceae bacterium]